MKVFIDPGHNYTGHDTGAAGNGLREQDITFYIGDKLRKRLEAAGIAVKMSRNNMQDCIGYSLNSSLRGRADMANKWDADIFVSIHCNAGGGHGAETYCCEAGITSGYRLAKAVQSRIINNVGLTDRGVKFNPSLAVLRLTRMPAILVETAFIDNASDAAILGSDQGQEKFAEAICTGICNYFGIKFTNKGELTMTQYEELKKEIGELREILTNQSTVLDGAVNLLKKLENPMIYNYIDENMPDWARPSIQKAVNKGFLQGTGEGLNLDDNLLRVFVLLDRAGALGE